MKALGLYILNFYEISWGERGRVSVLITVSVGMMKLCLKLGWWDTILELLLVGNIVSEVE